MREISSPYRVSLANKLLLANGPCLEGQSLLGKINRSQGGLGIIE